MPHRIAILKPVPPPNHPRCCICNDPFTLEMERDEGVCVNCAAEAGDCSNIPEAS